MNHLINVAGVTKHYKDFALDDVNLVVDPGEIVGLIGRNGAGKTTLIKSLLGIIRTNNGTIELLDDADEHAAATHERVGVVFDICPFVGEMRVSDVASLGKATFATWDATKFDGLCRNFSLDEGKRVKELSRGMGMRLQLAFALAHDPLLLVLDEPTAGLDPIAREEALDILRDFMDDDRAILISSHITTDLEHVADRIVCIDEGKIVFDVSKDDICDAAGVARCRADEVDAVIESKLTGTDKRVLHGAFSTDVLVFDRIAVAREFPDVTLDRATIEKYMTLMLKGDAR